MDQESRQKLHNLLVSEKLYSKPYNEFENQFSNPESQKKLYGLLKTEGLYSKSQQDFNNQFFSDVTSAQKKNPNPTQQVAKKPTASPSASGVTQSSSVSQSQKPKPAPAVKPVTYLGGQSQGALLMAPKKYKTQAEKVLEENKKSFDVLNPKWTSSQIKEDVDLLAKNAAERAKYLAQDIKKFNNDASILERDVTNYTSLAESNPNDPRLPLLQKELQKRQADIQSRSKSLQSNAQELDGAQIEINRKAIENYKQKAKQGNWGGYAWNKFIDGVSDLSAGVDEILAMYEMPIANLLDMFGAKTELAKEKPWTMLDSNLYRKEAKKKLLGMHQPTIEGWKSKETTPEYMQQLEKESSWASALGGVVSSLPAMAGGLPTLGVQSYGAFHKAAEQDPYLKTVPKQELDLIAFPLAMGTAWLEETGLSAMLGKTSRPVSSYLIKALSKVPKNAPMELVKKKFQDLIVKEAKQIGTKVVGSKIGQGVTKAAKTKAGKFATKLGGAGLVEAETEAVQGGYEEELKRLYNAVNDNESFKVANFASQEYLAKRAEEAKLGFMGSLILGGPIQAVQTVASGKQISDDDYASMRDMIMDPEQYKLMQVQIGLDVVAERITQEEGAKKLKEVADTRKILKTIPENLSIESQRKAYGILAKNAILQQEIDNTAKGIEGKDPNLVTGYIEYMKKKQAEIDANNAELSKLPQLPIKEKAEFVIPEPDEFGIIKFDFSSENEIPSELKNLTPVQMGTSTDKDGNKKIFRSYSVDQINPIRDALQKQATSQVPVQPEAGTGLQVAEGEPQAKPQVPTQEGQGQEVAPTEQPKATTIQDSIDADNTFTMRGKEGNLFVDDNGQVLFESGDEIVELGNISDIAETGLSDFGLEPKAPVAIEIGDDGSIMVAGKKYVNVAENPMNAITFDEDGNVKSVRLETENGQSRYFRGKRAESIAYQYTLQNFENNATDDQIDNALNQATEAATTQESTGEVTNETEDAAVDEGAKQENLDLDNVSETSGVKAKNLRQLIRINKKLFGLSWTKATMSAIAMDRMIGAMAKREGISKDEMYKRIEFRTKNQNAPTATAEVVTPQATAEVTAVEETPKQRKPRATKSEDVVSEQPKQEPTPEPQKEEAPKVNEFFKLNPVSNEIVIDIEKVKNEKPLAYEFLSKYIGFENATPKDVRNTLVRAYTQVMKYKKGAEYLLNQISELEDIVTNTKPENSTSKEEFKNSLRESGDFSEAELLVLDEVIDSLNVDALPKYSSSPEYLRAEGINPNSSNFYTFAKNILRSKDPDAFIHEVGHFSFYNILSKEDRLEFLKYMIESTYGKKGKSLASRIAMTSEKARFEEDGKIYEFGTNVADNFSEYFAEQFRQWYANKNLTPSQFDTIFAKVDKFLRRLIEKLRGGEYIDQSIVKYFEKISTKRPAFENVEITDTIEPTTPEETAYVEEQAAQPILWTKIPAKKGDPKIAARNKVIMQAAQDLLDGKITNEEYREIVQRESPIVPIEQFFEPATEAEVNNALSKDKVGLVDSPTEKGTTFTDSKGEEFEVTSDEVGLRLDIPAFINNNAWVVTVHGDVTNKKTGKKTKDKAISYGNVARITGVKFDFSPTQAIAVATKKQDKVPFLKMRGKMAPIEGATMDERAANAKKMVEQIKNDPAWTQIGSNPFKHSGFFNRATGQPILSADEVIQIGGLVYAKNVKETTWDNPIFEVKGEKGGPKPTDAAGKNVLFQGNRASVEIASDGTAIIYAMTDPNVSSPLHELAHVFQHYLTEAEWDTITKWAGSSKWSVETSEKFARGFEKYLSEGKSPSKELQAVFDKFKQWLTDIYNGITGSEIDIKLNPAMRKIYAQMFNEKVAKPKEAPSAQKILGIKPKMVTVDEMASLKGQLKLQAKAAKTAYEFAEAARKLVATYIKNNVQGALSPADQKAIFRAMEGKLDTPENKKKMIDKITGILQASEGKIAIKELDALGRMLKSMEKGSKLGAKAVADQIKSVVATIKSMGVKNQLKPAQVRLLLNGMAKNLMNATVREKFLASAQRVLNNAAYAEQVLKSQKLRAKIRKTLKRGKEIADVEQAVRNFLKLDPKMVEDLDEYMDYATEVFDAIRNVQVKDGNAQGKRAAVLANLNAYAAEQNAIQDEINKNMLLDEYQYLVDAGLISGDMTFDQINSYINSIENNPNSADSTKSDIIREYTKQAFAGFAKSAKELLEEGEYDEQDVDFQMINDFINMDIEALPLDQQLAAVESLENFVVNGVTSRMGAILQAYTGATNAAKNAASGMQARPLSYGLIGRLSYLKKINTKTIIDNLLGGIAAIGDLYNNLSAIYISKTDSLVTGLFRSTAMGIKFMKDSGFAGIVRGFVQGKKIVNDFAKKYSDKFEKSKPNGKAFNDASNVFERGIFADLSRTIKDGTPDQIAKEFERRKNQLKLTIETLKATGKKDLVNKANLYEAVYNKIKNAKNIEEVSMNIDPINQAAVKEFQDMWRKYYPEFKRMAADYYNVILDEDVNYSPDMYEKLAEDLSSDLLTKGAFKMGFDVISTEEVGTLKRNKRIEGLPVNSNTKEINRVRDYDFDFNNINALEKTLIDVRTTPFVQQYMGYTNSAAFKEIFPDFDDRKMIEKRLNFNINSLRERQDTYSSETARKINRFITSLSKYGTRIGLGSLGSAPKQSIPMMGNTMINLINDLDSFGMGVADFWNKDAMDFLENSGYGISLRGAESQTSIDFAEKLIDRANQGKVGNISESLSKLGDLYIEKFLKNPDVTVANMAWLAYYRNKLKSMGYDMSKFDWKNHELNEEAADYAEFMVQDQQNMNISELGGKLLASKDATTKTIRQLLFPFASYQFNLKDKNNRNITILTSKTSTNQEKLNAAKSLAAGLVESFMFQTIQGAIGAMLLKAAYAAIGYEEPEEEKTNGIWDTIKKAMPFVRTTSPSEKFNDSIFVGKSIFEFIAPIPPQLEYITMLKLNDLLDAIEGGTPEEQLKEKKKKEKELEEAMMGRKPKKRKLRFGGPSEEEKKAEKVKERMEKPFRFFAREELPYTQVVGDIVGGVPAVGLEALVDFKSRIDEAYSGSFKDKYGEYEYSEEQKKILKQSLIPRAMVAANIAPREFLTISNNIVKAVNTKAKEDTKAKKAESKKKSRF